MFFILNNLRLFNSFYLLKIRSLILNYFIKSGDTNAFGVTQALTYYAQHNASPEERYEIETESVLILDLIEEFDKVDIKRVVPSTIILN